MKSICKFMDFVPTKSHNPHKIDLGYAVAANSHEANPLTSLGQLDPLIWNTLGESVLYETGYHCRRSLQRHANCVCKNRQWDKVKVLLQAESFSSIEIRLGVCQKPFLDSMT